MKIEFTKEQYRTLLLLTHLGEWMINSCKTDERDEKASELLHHIWSYCKDFDEKELVDPKPDKGKYWGTAKLDEWGEAYIDDYDSDTFWEELIDRMAARELFKRHGKGGVLKMPFEEKMDKLDEIGYELAFEFEANGIENLSITNIHPFANDRG